MLGCTHDAVRPPEVPTAARYTATPVTEERLVQGKDIPAQWWTLFQSPALDGLVRQALDASPSLARANAKLRQAQEDLSARTGGTRFPKVDGKVSANRVDVNPQSLGVPALPVQTPFNLYLASVSVSYTFDLFGANRRELEGLQAGIDYQRYELEAARLTLAGNVVTAAIREASLREQIAATQEIVELQERQLAITERLVKLGTAAQADAVAQRLDLAQIRAVLPDLQRQLEQVRHRLAVYIGQPPGAAKLPEFKLTDLQLPPELPLGLPSELARQRPDIRAAEALLQQAGARVGVATANLYPQITLSANVGSLASSGGDLFSSGSGFYLLGASLTQPLFHGGELEAKRRSAIAAYEQAGAAYQEAVLQGFQNVADVLRALEADASKLKDRTEAATQARTYHDITSARFKAGGVSYFFLLDAQRKLHGALIDRTQALADRYADSAALFQALGGGWWQGPDR
ncbi:MAG TPA: efflux transporter outer membrane subunit [Burkholderiales bacterium]|jgi:NodT family efflux transporter outer membrane factor (OMF) lipoprotein|nr:efflux transporter outer membrane subunit [Burkholderiales bacterium]HXR58035.1 efflux transporter outer membrane subunit [Burkholderiales bacterium]